jgi:hypothetical protein
MEAVLSSVLSYKHHAAPPDLAWLSKPEILHFSTVLTPRLLEVVPVGEHGKLVKQYNKTCMSQLFYTMVKIISFPFLPYVMAYASYV